MLIIILITVNRSKEERENVHARLSSVDRSWPHLRWERERENQVLCPRSAGKDGRGIQALSLRVSVTCHFLERGRRTRRVGRSGGSGGGKKLPTLSISVACRRTGGSSYQSGPPASRSPKLTALMSRADDAVYDPIKRRCQHSGRCQRCRLSEVRS